MRLGKNWFRFFRKEVLPRRREVFLHRNVVGSLLAAMAACVALFVVPNGGQFPQITFSTLTTATLAFSGLSFGGSIGAIVLAIGLPTGRLFDTMVLNSAQKDFEPVRVASNMLATKSGGPVTKDHFPHSFRSTYLDLVFVFQMAAVAQLIFAIVSIFVLVTIGEESIRPDSPSLASLVGIAIMAFFGSYAILQLSSSLKALSSLARNRDLYHRTNLLISQRSSE